MSRVYCFSRDAGNFPIDLFFAKIRDYWESKLRPFLVMRLSTFIAFIDFIPKNATSTTACLNPCGPHIGCVSFESLLHLSVQNITSAIQIEEDYVF